MERLRIKNFLIIEEADFEVGRFNLIIGSQASGKSIIAKLLYFFRNFISHHYEDFDKTVKEIALAQFEEYFPRYAWQESVFDISYQFDSYEINLNYQNNLEITISQSLLDIYDYSKESYISGVTEGKHIYDEIFEAKIHFSFQNSIFIPASRSFFAHIQKNIFFLLKNNIAIDFFLKEFGAYYEEVKRVYRLKNSLYSKSELDLIIETLVKNILKGEYAYEAEQDLIVVNNHRTNLANASSGQQESLPMLMILSVWARRNKKSRIFIEESEAHLFPVSQKHVIELLSLLYNKHDVDFVLTTHSPYILTAINNAILAYDVIEKKGKDAVKDIFNPDFAIKYEDVRAYTVENGRLISIMDGETRLIGASVIDSVSDEFENVFNRLLEL